MPKIKTITNLARDKGYCNIVSVLFTVILCAGCLLLLCKQSHAASDVSYKSSIFKNTKSSDTYKSNIFTQEQSPQAKALTVQALRHVQEGHIDQARSLIEQAKYPLATKLYHWLVLINIGKKEWDNQLFIGLTRFIRHNPHWPNIKSMKRKAEDVMPKDLSNSEVLTWYHDFPPQSFNGMRRYADALIIEGQHEEVKKILAHWWASSTISRAQQKQILRDYDTYLTLDAHKKRCDTLLYKGEYTNAQAIAKLIGNGYPELARARIALARNKSAGLKKMIERVPVSLQNNSGLLYERLRWRRKHNLDDGALEILERTPLAETIQNKEKWWKERHIMIRRLLEKGRYVRAYDLAQNHIQEEGFSYAQAQWLAGWLALRFIKTPTEAYERFSVLYKKVKTPVSKARAAYWAGRAAKEMDQKTLAQSWYKKAAPFKVTFYGQLAGRELSLENQLPQKRLPSLTFSQRKDYERLELVQASDLFFKAEQSKMAERFMLAFLQKDQTPKAYRFAAEHAAENGGFHLAVKLTKKAMKKGLFLTKQSYPTITKHLKHIDYTEWALIHAVARQESMFDIKAKSSAGALGLMQLMPSTARHIAKKKKIPYRRAWLTSKPEYNLTLGAHYLEELINRYDGSYPLAVAAYNAGPRRVDRWLEMFGDPRTGQVSLIDWVELLPIYETRNYVQRVMEGLYIYRLRLG